MLRRTYLIETVLLSTLNIYFGLRKKIFLVIHYYLEAGLGLPEYLGKISEALKYFVYFIIMIDVLKF